MKHLQDNQNNTLKNTPVPVPVAVRIVVQNWRDDFEVASAPARDKTLSGQSTSIVGVLSSQEAECFAFAGL